MGSEIAYKMYSMCTTIRNVDRIPDLVNILLDYKSQNGKINFQSGGRSRDAKIEKEKLIDFIISKGFLHSHKVSDSIIHKLNSGEQLTKEEIDEYKFCAPQLTSWSGRLANYLQKAELLGLVLRTGSEVEFLNNVQRFLDNPQMWVINALSYIPSNIPYISRRKNKITPLGAIAKYFEMNKGKERIGFDALAIVLSAHNEDHLESLIKNADFSFEKLKEISEAEVDEKTVYAYCNEMVLTLEFTGFFERDYNGIRASKKFLSNVDQFLVAQKTVVKEVEEIVSIYSLYDWLNLLSFRYILDYDRDTKITNAAKIKKLSDKFSLEEIKQYILDLYSKKRPEISEINENVYLFVIAEWLWAIYFCKIEKNAEVTPYLSLDVNGYPLSQAPGGTADIVVKTGSRIMTVEITLHTNGKQLLNSECINLVNHAEKIGADAIMLLAPKVHANVQTFLQLAAKDKDINAVFFSFINAVNDSTSLQNILKQPKQA